MDDPFFGNHRWYQQPAPTRYPFSRSPSFRGVPVYDVDPSRETRRPEKKPGPRVVPVQFVGVDRSGCALKIQKVFRGFLVRKCMKKVKDIKVEVDKIEERVLKSEVVELIRRDEKERLRMNESLMSLLFKLDSICGVDFGVRACRKAVIRKVIALQERIDAIVVVAIDDDLDGNRENDPPQSVVDQEEAGDLSNSEDCVDIIDVGVDCEVKVSESNCVKDGVDENVDDSIGERVREKGVEERKGKDDIDNKRMNGELLERMMEDNEKMMSLMTQLFERNETQMRMLNALTHRVELLEKAFVCDKLRRKKQKKKKKKNKACDAAAMRTED